MNVVDENIIAPERERLRAWRVHFRHLGGDIGRLGMKDREEIVPLLHTLRQPAFFTRDHGFYRLALLHRGYCLVYLDVEVNETATYIRRFLRHTEFRTQSQRMGRVVRVRHSSVSYWEVHQRGEHALSW
jgi:hypothetical protein